MHQGICKACGGAFWESSPGARGEDLCDQCEDKPPVALRKPAGTIDLTPTWEQALPIILTALRHGTTEGKEIARRELGRMAKLADLQVKAMKEAALDTSAAGLVPPIGTGL